MSALRRFLDWSIPAGAWRLGGFKVTCVRRPGVTVSGPQFAAQAMRAAQWDELRRVAERHVYRAYLQAVRDGDTAKWEQLQGRRHAEKWLPGAAAKQCMLLGDQAYACGAALSELVELADPTDCKRSDTRETHEDLICDE
jgi:hypothetical protein